jgi:hypothetical protein
VGGGGDLGKKYDVMELNWRNTLEIFKKICQGFIDKLANANRKS